MKMDGNKPDKKRKLGLGGVFPVLLMGILLAFFVSNNTMGLKGTSDNAVDADCKSHLYQIGHRLYSMAKKSDSKALKGATIPDLLREAAHGGDLDEKCLHCSANGAPYLVFSVPAALFFQHSEIATADPVPIVMDSPGAHGRLGTNVLYSDGSVRGLTTEEAEALVAEKLPAPLIPNPAYGRVRSEGGESHLVLTKNVSPKPETP